MTEYEFDERLSEHLAPSVDLVAECDACGTHDNLAYGEHDDISDHPLRKGFYICAACIYRWDKLDLGEDVTSDILERRKNDREE